MKRTLSFTFALLMCLAVIVGCSKEEKELTFHDILKSEYFSIAKCFKHNSIQDVTKEIDGETVEKHLSNMPMAILPYINMTATKMRNLFLTTVLNLI